MPRIRTVKPEFFTHYDLFLAEQESGFPIRLAFQGLWLCSDKEGRFKWQPEQLKLNVLPYDKLDFIKVLEVLVNKDFIIKYEVNGRDYGCVPTLKDHQRFSGKESQSESKLPAPPIKGRKREATGKQPGKIGEAPENTGREGKGVRKGVRSTSENETQLETENLCYDIEKFLNESQKDFEAVCLISPIKDANKVREILHKYHLYNIEHERYPKKRMPLIAGFQKWLINEKNWSKNGQHSPTTMGKTFEPD